MLDYDDVLSAVIAACPYSEDLRLANSGPLDSDPDVLQSSCAYQLQTLVKMQFKMLTTLAIGFRVTREDRKLRVAKRETLRSTCPRSMHGWR